MRKQWLVFFFTLCSLLHPLHAQQAEEGKEEKKEIPVPNPLELDKGFWDYFEVPVKELPDKINTFKAKLDDTLSFPAKEEHQEIFKTQEEINFNLELLNKKRSELVPTEPPKIQFLKSYNPADILKTNRRLMNTLSDIGQTNDRIAFKKSKTARLQNQLDRQVLRYSGLSSSSYERLLAGLKILEYRIEIAVHRIEIDHLNEKLAYLTKQKNLLSEELKIAKDRVSYQGLAREELEKAIQLKKELIEKAQAKLDELEKLQLRKKNGKDIQSDLLCCLWNYQIITQTIHIENLKVEAMINEVKLMLFNIAHPENGKEVQEIRQLIGKWEDELGSSREFLKQWQKRLENEHARVSKEIAQTFKSEEENYAEESTIANIHLELDQSFALLEELKTHIAGTEHLLQLLQKQFVEERSIAETWTIRAKTYWYNAVEAFKDQASMTLFYIKEQPVTIGTVLEAIITIVAALIISKYLRHLLATRVLVGRRFTKSTRYIILRFLHYGMIVIALVVALGIIGLDMTNLAIVAGALGVGIGFGLQTMVNNILSGFTLLLNRYLNVGDIVEMQGSNFATVQAVNLQFTHICTFDGADMIIPNSELSTRGLTNWTMRNSFRRFKIPFGVAYGSDKEKLQEVIVEAMMQQPYIVAGRPPYPDPHLWFVSYGDSSMNFELVAWVDLNVATPYGIATSSMLWEIDNVLAKHGFEIPFPQRDLHIKDYPEKSGKDSEGFGETQP